jgi:hypothetical protein
MRNATSRVQILVYRNSRWDGLYKLLGVADIARKGPEFASAGRSWVIP